MSERGKHNNHPAGAAHHAFAHGESKKTAEHAAWLEMRKRCLCKTNRAYPNYGGRGITICDRWSVFENFLEDMGRKPSPSHSLDRERNDGNYEPGNCRWATRTEQSRNRRNSVVIPFNGAATPIQEVADATGISRVKIWKRIFLLGWDAERAVQA